MFKSFHICMCIGIKVSSNPNQSTQSTVGSCNVKKKIMFDTEKVRSLTFMGKKSSEWNYSLSFFSPLQVENVFFILLLS